MAIRSIANLKAPKSGKIRDVSLWEQEVLEIENDNYYCELDFSEMV